MSFQSDKANLESAFDVLKQQWASTFENWDDPVQRRFYEQFINSLPKEFYDYITALSKLDKSFEKAEQTINNLQQ
jgi:flagellar biosynthesis chaperone FliJ